MSKNFPGTATAFGWVSVFFRERFNLVVGFSFSCSGETMIEVVSSLRNEFVCPPPIERCERVFNLPFFFLSLPLKISLCFMVFAWNVFERSVVSLLHCFFFFFFFPVVLFVMQFGLVERRMHIAFQFVRYKLLRGCSLCLPYMKLRSLSSPVNRY